MCSKELPWSSFRKRKNGTPRAYCFGCQRVYDKEYWHRTRERRLYIKRKLDKRLRKRNSMLVYEYLKKHPCVDCGEDNPVVLEFDHVGDKTSNVADLISQRSSVSRLKNEMSRCEVRCANCHRIKTAERGGWYNGVL